MTSVGVARARYARDIEPRPSRFADPAKYSAWAKRADAREARRVRFSSYLASEIASWGSV